MAEHTHHHHHHHHTDEATEFKRKSLLSIRRRKVLTKYAFGALCSIALIMAIAVVVVYWLT